MQSEQNHRSSQKSSDLVPRQSRNNSDRPTSTSRARQQDVKSNQVEHHSEQELKAEFIKNRKNNRVKGEGNNGEAELELHDLSSEPVKGSKLKNQTKLQAFLSKTWVKRVLIIIAMLIETFDLLADWFFFYDVYITAQGVVFGRVTPSIKWTLLGISILGTATFTVEMINLWSDLLHRKEIIDGEIASVLNVWVEDVPHMLLNLGIAACRESATSYVQLVKASAILIASLMRIILTVLRYHMSDHYCKCSPKTQRNLRIATVVGMVITFLCAVGVFVFSNLYPDSSGRHRFHVPDTLWEEQFNRDRYFKNVHIFATGPGIQTLCDPTNSTRWVRGVAVQSIMDAGSDGLVMQYETDRGLSGTQFRISSWRDDARATGLVNSTYRITDVSKCVVQPAPSLRSAPGSLRVRFKLLYIPPETNFFARSRLLLGDIRYAWSFRNSSACIPGAGAIRKQYGTLRYARYNRAVNESSHLISGASGLQMYTSENLENIATVWKTGFFNCKTSGNTDPTFDSMYSADVKC